MKHSRDSLSSQLTEVQKQAKTAEQALLHRNAELQAVQKQLDSVHKRITVETDQLLSEREAALQTIQERHLKLIETAREQLATLEASVTAITADKATLEAAIQEKKAELEVIKKEVATTRAANSALIAENTALVATNRSVAADTQRLSEQRSTLRASLETLKATITEKQAAIDQLTADIAAQEATITASKEKYHQELGILEAKLMKKANVLIEIDKNVAITRDSLASWEKRLQEQDTNLRIREEKVQEGEGKILRHSNLLKL